MQITIAANSIAKYIEIEQQCVISNYYFENICTMLQLVVVPYRFAYRLEGSYRSNKLSSTTLTI